MPVGTEIDVTDSVARIAEHRIMSVLGENNPIVESVVTNVAFLASEIILTTQANRQTWQK